MKSRKLPAIQEPRRIVISVAVFAAVFLLFHLDFLKRFELVTYDYRCLSRPVREADSRIAAIEISEDSIQEIGRWPWTRDWHATLIDVLTEAGAKAIIFDVIFSEPSEEKMDFALAEAIKKSKRVYLASIFEREATGLNLLSSMPQFTDHVKSEGFITIQPDVDGVMRRAPLLLDYKKNRVSQLAFAAVLDEMGVKAEEVKVDDHRMILPMKDGDLTVPLDGEGRFIVNWLGPWTRTFKHYSYREVITSYMQKVNGKKQTVPLSTFRDKICVVGPTAAGLFDIRPTPLEPAYPGMGLHLTILDNFLQRRFVRPAGYAINALVLALLALTLFQVMKMQSYIRAALLTVFVAVAYVFVAVQLFVRADIWVNVVYPLMLVFFTYFFVTLYNQLSIAIEKAKLVKMATRDSLTGLFNIGHFKLLLKAEITTISLRREKNLSLVMGDVDNFKKTNDTYGHVTGDTVLKEVATAVKSNCRALDVAARYGGEEFILMLPGANVDQAFKVAENIRKAIASKMFFHEKGDFNTTISIGVTQVSPDEKDIEAIVVRADRALYEAKQTGKNKVVIASDSPQFKVGD